MSFANAWLPHFQVQCLLNNNMTQSILRGLQYMCSRDAEILLSTIEHLLVSPLVRSWASSSPLATIVSVTRTPML